MQVDKKYELWREVFMVAIAGRQSLNDGDIERGALLADKAIIEVEKRIEADRAEERRNKEEEMRNYAVWSKAGWNDPKKQ